MYFFLIKLLCLYFYCNFVLKLTSISLKENKTNVIDQFSSLYHLFHFYNFLFNFVFIFELLIWYNSFMSEPFSAFFYTKIYILHLNINWICCFRLRLHGERQWLPARRVTYGMTGTAIGPQILSTMPYLIFYAFSWAPGFRVHRSRARRA